MTVDGGAYVKIDVAKMKELIYLRTGGGRGSQGRFARMCGIDPSIFCRILKRGNCAVFMLGRIATAMGVEPDEFVADIGMFKSKPQAYRLRAGLSRQQLAEKAGVTESCVSRVEMGDRDCLAFTAACLSKALGVPMGKYLGYED
jgi:DNA-binding XRE family transcriptional regulator